MKNATVYEKKVRKLLSGMGKSRLGEGWAARDPMVNLIEFILEGDSFGKMAKTATAALLSEYVDLNEMRVSPVKDLVECIGRDYPLARIKAETLIKALNAIFDRQCVMSVEYMRKMSKRDLRKHLLGIGLNHYSAGCMLLMIGGHAVPVDGTLVECLEMEEYIHPGTGVEEVQGFLERMISPKEGIAAHEFFRTYVEKSSKALLKKRKDEAAKARAAAEAEAARLAAEQAKAQAAIREAEERKAAKEAKAAEAAKLAEEKKAAKAEAAKKGDAGKSVKKDKKK
jgi:endonuclease III